MAKTDHQEGAIMRKLINRIRDLSDRLSARIHQDDLHALNARVGWLEERVNDLEGRLARAQAELVIQEHLEKAELADSDTTVTRLKPR
jgi:predicted  nucleic acid-binding Zn-ribbon protein